MVIHNNTYQHRLFESLLGWLHTNEWSDTQGETYSWWNWVKGRTGKGDLIPESIISGIYGAVTTGDWTSFGYTPEGRWLGQQYRQWKDYRSGRTARAKKFMDMQYKQQAMRRPQVTPVWVSYDQMTRIKKKMNANRPHKRQKIRNKYIPKSWYKKHRRRRRRRRYR